MRNGAWGVGRGAWVLAASGLVGVVWAARVPIGGALVRDTGRPSPPPSALVRARPPYAADSFARVALTRSVFRAARRPSAVAYDPARGGVPVLEEYRPPKPVLVLVGVVGGPHPTAVIEGFPGVDGARVVAIGDVVAGLTVKRIANNGVRIVGLDTTWVLEVREPWK